MKNTLHEWVIFQKETLKKTNAILKHVLDLCACPASKIDTLSLEVLTTNLIMHIEQIMQYDSCITTLYKSTNNLPDDIHELYLCNKQELPTLLNKYNIVQALLTQKKIDLSQQLLYTQKVITQLIT